MAAEVDREAWTHHFVQRLLQAGLVVAFALLLVGLVIGLASGSAEAPPLRLFDLLAPDVRLADRVMGLGALVLAITPAMRVLSLVVLWARERDLRFVMVAIAVLIVLTIAVVLGHG